jgi:hypothetical protein
MDILEPQVTTDTEINSNEISIIEGAEPVLGEELHEEVTDTGLIDAEVGETTPEELPERFMTADEITEEMREAGVDENTVLITDPETIAQLESDRLATETQ